MLKGKRLKKGIIAIVIVVVIIIIALVLKKNSDKKKMNEAMKDNAVVTTNIEKMDLQQSISVTGTLAAVDSASVTSKAQNVKVESIKYEVGDYVEAGATVVTFDGDDYDRQLAELGLESQIANLENESNVQSALKDITSLQNDIKGYQQDIEEAQEYLDKYENVYNNLKDIQSAIDKDQNDTAAQERWSREKAAAQALSESVSIEAYESKQDTVKDLQEKIDDANLQLQIKQYSYELALLKQQKQTEYTEGDNYNTIYEQRDATKVTAPISGYITSINVSEGNNYTQGSTVFTISDVSAFVVEGTVDEYDISSLELEQSCVVKFDSTDDDEFTGKISYVAIAPSSTSSSSSSSSSSMTSSSSSSSSATYAVKIALDSTDSRLRVGMTAKAAVILDSVTDVLAVPYDCVEKDNDDSYYVTKINDDGEEEKITVTKGLESDFYVEIQGNGIEEGTKIKATQATGSGDDNSFDNFGNGPSGGAPGGGPSGGGPGGF